jgi:hypothetical protein
MDNKALLDIILSKEGANEALQELTSQFNVNDSNDLKNHWTEVEQLLLNFKVTRYSITSDFLFCETVIQPFKTGEEVEEVKRYLLN